LLERPHAPLRAEVDGGGPKVYTSGSTLVGCRGPDPAVDGAGDDVDHLQKMGLDLKYGVTADLTLNGTIQPDFGQVEADPATLNLSPFETFFQEKRPFFIEGAKFFTMANWNLFYSRRIGTGDENSRIRVAGKVTGKTQSGISVGLLAATTDVATEQRNPFHNGTLPADAFVGRVGKEWKDGNYQVNLMGTASLKRENRDAIGDPSSDDADLHSRDAYTGGLDFNLNFKNRMYQLGYAQTYYLEPTGGTPVVQATQAKSFWLNNPAFTLGISRLF